MRAPRSRCDGEELEVVVLRIEKQKERKVGWNKKGSRKDTTLERSGQSRTREEMMSWDWKLREIKQRKVGKRERERERERERDRERESESERQQERQRASDCKRR